jgi:hypothetical protein
MPDRILRAKILTSDLVNSLSWPGEVFYRRLMSAVDDYGRYDARVSILRSSLYALKLDKVSDADIVKWLGECSKAGLISVYQVQGKDYLEILQFRQRLRAMKSQYPPPEDGKEVPPADIGGQMTAHCEHMSPEEKGREVESDLEKKGREMVFSLAHCKMLALRDPRWVKANSTNEKELEDFNSLLEKRAHYEKNPADYKSHFANWKMGGKKDVDVKQNDLPAHMKQNSTGHLKPL